MPLNGFDFFARDLHPGVSDTIRFREYYFQVFSWVPLALMVCGWLLPWVRPIRDDAGTRGSSREIAKLLSLWSAVTFVVMFAFYARTPSMTSRYLVDFVPAVSAGILTVLLTIGHWTLRLGPRHRAAATAALVVVAVFGTWVGIRNRQVEPTYAVREAITVQEALDAVRAFPPSTESIPETYECGDAWDHNILSNLNGWEYAGGCEVSAVTTVVVESPDCLEFTVDRIPDPEGPAAAYSIDDARVKVQSTMFERVRTEREGSTERHLYCGPAEQSAQPPGIPQIAGIAWVKAADLGAFDPPVRLLRVGRVPRPR